MKIKAGVAGWAPPPAFIFRGAADVWLSSEKQPQRWRPASSSQNRCLGFRTATGRHRDCHRQPRGASRKRLLFHPGRAGQCLGRDGFERRLIGASAVRASRERPGSLPLPHLPDPHCRKAARPRIMSTEIRSGIFRVLFLALSQTTRVGRSELQKFLWSLGDSASPRGLLLPPPCPPSRTGTGPGSPGWVWTHWTSPGRVHWDSPGWGPGPVLQALFFQKDDSGHQAGECSCFCTWSPTGWHAS